MEDVPERGQSKPLLNAAQQIAHLKSKGVTFELVSEEEAAEFLTSKTYFFKLYAYRDLFQKRVGGEHDGEYVGLDFGHLKMLASIDQQLRYTLLPLTLDVEHFARTKLMQHITSRPDEDGYAIVSDYLSSLDVRERTRREQEVSRLGADVYCGELVRKYPLGSMPAWVFLELTTFGTLIDFYLFCSKRWNDRRMKDEHYLLRQAKAARNAAAHSSNIINGFAGQKTTVKTSPQVGAALTSAGLSKRTRRAKMANPRLQQIATLLYLHWQLVPAGTSRTRAIADLARLRDQMSDCLEALPGNDAVQSSFRFLMVLFDKWFLQPS